MSSVKKQVRAARKQDFLRYYLKHTQTKAAAYVGVSASTIRLWRSLDPSFDEALKAIKEGKAQAIAQSVTWEDVHRGRAQPWEPPPEAGDWFAQFRDPETGRIT